MTKYWIARSKDNWTVREQTTNRYVCEYPIGVWGNLAIQIIQSENDQQVWKLVEEYYNIHK